MKHLQIKRELNSIEDVTETLSYIRTVVPENMQHIINSQLRVLNYAQSPTLIDSTFTTLITEYEAALLCTNSADKEDIKRKFQHILHNLVFYIDAKTQYAIDKNNSIGKKLLVDASEMLALSVRDVIRTSLHLCVATGKIAIANTVAYKAIQHISSMANEAMDHIEFMHMDTVTGIAAASQNVVTTITAESTTIEEKGIDPQNASIISDYSNKSQKILGDISEKASKAITEETDKQYQRSSSAINEAHAAIDSIVVNNMFGEERIGKIRSLIGTLYDWIGKDKKNKKLKKDFVLSMQKLIDKIIKYKALIGPSIIVSDMVERYLPDIEKELSPRSFTTPWYCYVIVIFVEIALSLLIAIGRFVYYSNKEAPDNWFGNQMLYVAVIVTTTCCCLAIPTIIKHIKKRKIRHIMKWYKREAEYFNPYSKQNATWT